MLKLFIAFFLIPALSLNAHEKHHDKHHHHKHHEKHQKKHKKKLLLTDWTSSYAEWIDPKNNFVDYIDAYDQARVIFIGSSAYSADGQGQRPSTSEGMGYGLLLAYAYNDQTTFDKFLRYTLATAQNYGCSLFDGGSKTCLANAPFMMPWIVNEAGQPFWYEALPEGRRSSLPVPRPMPISRSPGRFTSLPKELMQLHGAIPLSRQHPEP